MYKRCAGYLFNKCYSSVTSGILDSNAPISTILSISKSVMHKWMYECTMCVICNIFIRIMCITYNNRIWYNTIWFFDKLEARLNPPCAFRRNSYCKFFHAFWTYLYFRNSHSSLTNVASCNQIVKLRTMFRYRVLPIFPISKILSYAIWCNAAMYTRFAQKYARRTYARMMVCAVERKHARV